MKFDDILLHIGEFGSYQKRVYVLCCLPAISIAFQTLVPVFNLAIPDFRCAVPGDPNDTYKSQGPLHNILVNRTVPWEDDDSGNPVLSTCNLYSNGSISNATEECSAWVYDKSTFISTALAEFNIVCGSKGWRATSNSLNFAGSLVGALGLGLLSDLIGRKKTLFISAFFHSASAIAIAFAPNMAAFMAFRFLNGVANAGVFMTAFVIGMEMVGPSKRVIAGIVIELFWCLGLFILGAVAYGIRDWRKLQLVLSCPSVLLMLMWWFIPESPRWLLSHGRDEEAEVILRKAAKVNGVTLPDKLFDRSTVEDTGPQARVWEIFTTPRLLVRTLIIFFNWCVISMTYYGLGLNVQNLSGDIYLNFTIANIVETLGYSLCLVFLDRTGRKILHSGSMFLGGLACLSTIFPVLWQQQFGRPLMYPSLDQYYPSPTVICHAWITTALSMVGKLGASAAFGIIYVFSAELFPTIVRNSGMGSSSTCARVGGIISPFIADLGVIVGGNLKTALPLIVFGSLTLGAGGMSLLLPETLNRKLPDSIHDAKEFGKGKDSKTKYTMHITEGSVDSKPDSQFKRREDSRL